MNKYSEKYAQYSKTKHKTLLKAIEDAGYNPGEDFMISIDAAATEMYEEAKKIDQEGKYYFWKTNELKTKE